MLCVAGILLLAVFSAAAGSAIDEQMQGLTYHSAVPQPLPAGPFQPTWTSLSNNYVVPTWFNNAKFGIFIHFGLYAVPAYHNEWYAKYMYNGTFNTYHQQHYGYQDAFGYKDFIPMFKAAKFDATAWAALFKNAGAQYVVPVAEHHDGFAMYDSDLTIWCASKMGPKRDIIGELANAIRAQGMVFGVSNHRMEHYMFEYPSSSLLASGLNNDLFNPKYAQFYGPPRQETDSLGQDAGNAPPDFQREWLARCEELVDRYHPQLFYFDNGVNQRKLDNVKLAFAAYYYNRAAQWGQQVTIATKRTINADSSITEAYLAGSVEDYEKSGKAPGAIQYPAWQCDDAIAGNSWGYVNPMTYRTASSILGELIDLVSKNGNLLLNISPMADGSIPQAQQQILLTIGQWLGTNGTAIYGTHPWTSFQESGGGVTYHHTVKDGILYAAASTWPGATATLPSVTTGVGTVTKVELLGSSAGALGFSQTSSGLTVTMPGQPTNPAGISNYTLKISGLNLP